MKILIISDIHFEFHKDGGVSFLNSIKSNPDVCIIAGDLCSSKQLKQSIKLVSERFKNIVYVHGNHECYGSSIQAVKKLIKTSAPDNFHFLDNSFVEIMGQRFIGCCLWFPWDLAAPFYFQNMSDFYEIQNKPDDFYEENKISVRFLENNVEENDIVITHHLPSEKSVASRFRNSTLNRFFVCPVDELILDEKPKIWVHGHTHDSLDYQLGDTRVVCNPFGYAGYEENKKFLEFEIEI